MSNFEDDYNYPPLNRKDLLAYRGLDNRDFRIRKFKQLDTKRNWSLNNYTLDISGASPRKLAPFTKKPDFSNTNEDIEKSSPSPKAKYLNKPDFTLSNQGIEKSSPRGHHCFKTSRHVNPLEPEYPLPTCHTPFEPYQPKFLRNSIDVSDIVGAQPKKYLKWEKRDNLNIFNDEKEKKKLEKRTEANKKPYDYLDFRDVYVNKSFSNRKTSPLDPEYTMCFNGGVKYTYGEIEGSKPVVFSKYHNEKTGCNLKTEDIEGAKPGTKTNLQKFKLKNNRPLLYSAEDIVGSHPGSKKYGLDTKRCINPLMPEYQFLGRTEENNKLENDRYRRKNKYQISTTETNQEDVPVNKSSYDISRSQYQINKDNIIHEEEEKEMEKKNNPIVTPEDFKELPYVVDE